MGAVLEGLNVPNLEGFRSFVVRFMIQMSRVGWLFKSSLTQLSYSVLVTLGQLPQRKTITQRLFRMMCVWPRKGESFLYLDVGFYLQN